MRWILLSWILASCGAAIERAPSQDGSDILTITHKNTNVYLVAQDDHYVMIDAGYAGTQKDLLSAMNEESIDPDKILHLVLTHAHGDHVGCAAFFQEQYKIEVIAGLGDREALEEGKNGRLCPTSAMAKMLNWFMDHNFPALKADTYLAPGDSLNLTQDITIFTLPGHTPGSLILKYKSSLFVGDLIRGRPLNNDRPNRHYYMCELEGNDKDIEGLARMEGIDIWYPGHFGPLSVTSVKRWLKNQVD